MIHSGQNFADYASVHLHRAINSLALIGTDVRSVSVEESFQSAIDEIRVAQGLLEKAVALFKS